MLFLQQHGRCLTGVGVALALAHDVKEEQGSELNKNLTRRQRETKEAAAIMEASKGGRDGKACEKED